MNYERSKAPLALMEQIIMILVFALAAAVCLQAFVYANGLSGRGEKENIAAAHAQEVIEMCKACAGGPQRLCPGLKVSTLNSQQVFSTPSVESAYTFSSL